MNKQRIKAGKGYYQRGHGRGFISSPVIWEIRGKYYAKHRRGWELAFKQLTGPLSGYVEVHKLWSLEGGKLRFFQS